MSDFRFFDSRQKYLLFVTTTNEKATIANHISPLVSKIVPQKPALKIFDAGLGDGTLLMHVLRDCHRQFPTIPFLVVGKEISLEDVRLTSEKLPDRFIEHPNMIFILTNMHYNEAVKLKTNNPKKEKKTNWHKVALKGNSSFEFSHQLNNLDDILKESWQVEKNKNGNTTYKDPSVIVIFREDQEMTIDNIIPRKDQEFHNFDLIIASQPYRSRISEKQKVNYVINPMINSLDKNGKLVITHAYGNDPGSDLIKKIWPNDNPFPNLGKDIMNYLKNNLDVKILNNLIFHKPKIFKYYLRALPNEIENGISTSLVFSAWNNINYVAQINDDKIKEAEKNGNCFGLLSDILKQNEGLFFNNEFLVIEKI